MNGPLDHLAREVPPWREATTTECGRPLGDVAQIITRAAAVRRWKDQGAKRASFSLCMTCVETANRNPTFDENPIENIRRTLPAAYAANRERLDTEERHWRAVAALIDAHRDDFDQLLADLAKTPTIAEARRNRQAKAAEARDARGR